MIRKKHAGWGVPDERSVCGYDTNAAAAGAWFVREAERSLVRAGCPYQKVNS
jgi:hypothetical protein